MGKRILLIQGHPDSSQLHLCHALEDAYAQGAMSAKHEIKRINVATLDFPLLRSQQEWEKGDLPHSLIEPQAAIKWAEHMVLFFPLWLGDMPAFLKGFLEQVARPGFAFSGEGKNPLAHKGLSGRSARVVVTMGMPATLYRWFYRAHSIRSLERNILGFVGISPVNETLIGMVGNMEAKNTNKWFVKLEKLGLKGD
ncbi:NAD(P)H-dependent oxidoreductase [Sulfurirhabdus autotrophica]|uniref:Putative NADPH-quinone reductase n=1 Tax=Sulfurirhabdus autotrophica TaxID=1706046 RepID=A0A4R3YEI0_9PROT|nr:NAD(P)H-dependent oxidoreductase [Sulfurirhabdus autotrophica]TCV90567.1 putative NADPH-quinone reductase [Sulfurirhabdus autotrophica]